jgi:hypothetical protein
MGWTNGYAPDRRLPPSRVTQTGVTRPPHRRCDARTDLPISRPGVLCRRFEGARGARVGQSECMPDYREGAPVRVHRIDCGGHRVSS